MYFMSVYMCLSPGRSGAVDLFCHFLKRKNRERSVSRRSFAVPTLWSNRWRCGRGLGRAFLCLSVWLWQRLKHARYREIGCWLLRRHAAWRQQQRRRLSRRRRQQCSGASGSRRHLRHRRWSGQRRRGGIGVAGHSMDTGVDVREPCIGLLGDGGVAQLPRRRLKPK